MAKKIKKLEGSNESIFKKLGGLKVEVVSYKKKSVLEFVENLKKV